MELGTSTKMGQMSDRLRAIRNAKRLDRLDEENDRLRTELRMTKSQLEHEREHEQDVLEALNRASERKTEVTTKPRGGLLRLVVVGGAAYVFGTQAGRERYEDIRAWLTSTKDRLTGAQDPADTSSPVIGRESTPLTASRARSAGSHGSADGRG
jgi:hypothetical protein